MTDADFIVESLINTEGIHAFVFVCEAADKYLPLIESITIQLADGRTVRATDLDRAVAQKVDETRATLKREDRITWALRLYKKALISQILWMVENNPRYFKRKFKSPPAPEQPALMRQLEKLAPVDLSPFEEFNPEDPRTMDSPYSGFATIDAINQRIGYYLQAAEAKQDDQTENMPGDEVRYRAQDVYDLLNARSEDKKKQAKINDRRRRMLPKLITGLIFEPNMAFGEIISLFRRAEMTLRRLRFPGGIEMLPTPNGPYDLADKEGPVETLIEFPEDGWRWFDLHRVCSPMRDDRTAPPDIAITGHCANVAARTGMTALELAEPLSNNRWKHHAFFVLHSDGSLGEMKGRKNQKPSPRLEKYIFGLLRRDKRIKHVGHSGSYLPQHDFRIEDLTPNHIRILKAERPELFTSSPQEV